MLPQFINMNYRSLSQVSQSVGLPSDPLGYLSVCVFSMMFACVCGDFSLFFVTRTQLIKRTVPLYSTMSNTEVHHNKEASYFCINLGKEKAILEYEKEGKHVLNMWHTEVPVSHRGQGLGACLAKAALHHAVENKLQVKPTCTFIQKYLKDNPLPEYTNMIIPVG